MKRSEMLESMVSVYESILDSERGDSFESIVEALLVHIEEKGMEPPEYKVYFGETKVATGYHGSNKGEDYKYRESCWHHGWEAEE